MLYVYLESDEITGIHWLCLGTEEMDENAFVVQEDRDESFLLARAQILANTLRLGGAQVQLH